MPVTHEIVDGLGVVRFSHPPVNALSVSAGLVPALAQAIQEMLARSDVTAIVLSGEGRHFSAGADISEFEGDLGQLNQSRALNTLIETAQKPVVMRMHGLALGGGLELAMAGHYRIASETARFGLPEVKLGILPGGGGTQRLPRLVGVKVALDLMLSGKQIGAARALELGLIDAVCGEDWIATAREVASGGVRPVASRPCAAKEGEIEAFQANEKSGRGWSEAESAIVTCVQNAIGLPFEEGLQREKEAFESLMRSEASRGLRYAFCGEREVGRIPRMAKDAGAPAITSVAVVGGGLMGTGIVIALLNADFPVVLVEANSEARERARDRISTTINRDVEKGRVSGEAAERRLSGLSISGELEAVAAADLIIEAVFETLEVKRAVFEALDRIAKPSAILASNTSTLDLDAIAGFTGRPSSIVGLHFFSPANIMKLLEIVRGDKTDSAVLTASLDFARKINKIGVVAGNCDGFIGNRMFEEYLRQAYFLLEEGALPDQIDTALEAWGMAMGPLRTMDLAGQDIGYSIRRRRAVEQPDRPYSPIPDMVCEKGRYGQKTGAGFYLYPDGRKAVADPEIDAMIVQYSAKLGIDRRDISNREIVQRCIFALINEGARILDEGIAYRPVDIDMVWLNGYGFPRKRGGPMFFAGRHGMSEIVEQMAEYARGPNGWPWKPAPLLIELASGNKSLSGWEK